MAADDYHLDLVRCTAEELALAYQLVTGKASKGVSKAAMVSALGNAFDRRCIGCHAKYLASLPTEQKHAVDEYRGSGYIYMNYALRTGRMKVMLNWWQLSERLSTVDWQRRAHRDLPRRLRGGCSSGGCPVRAGRTLMRCAPSPEGAPP
jgi:hypothetical protein